MNLRRDKDVDGYFTGDYLLIYSPNSLIESLQDKYTLLSLNEKNIIAFSYLKYDFNKEVLDKLVAEFESKLN